MGKGDLIDARIRVEKRIGCKKPVQETDLMKRSVEMDVMRPHERDWFDWGWEGEKRRSTGKGNLSIGKIVGGRLVEADCREDHWVGGYL